MRLGREFVESFLDQNPVEGLTHDFYRYPARFSPRFAGASIEAFTSQGDLVLDPFMGGATSLVEAFARGRRSLGSDISQLARFLARVKTTLLDAQQETVVRQWIDEVSSSTSQLNREDAGWRNHSYLRNLGVRGAWPLRDLVVSLVVRLGTVEDEAVRNYLRCAVLRTAQWAIDGKRKFPNTREFRQQLASTASDMLAGLRCLALSAKPDHAPAILSVPAHQLSPRAEAFAKSAPALVLTSPPYPGVHVLYHRWQLNGGLETAIPFWIADCNDGYGEAHYTFGHRSTHAKGAYFSRLQASFERLAKIADRQTLFVQIVGFARPRTFLPQFLRALAQAGLQEVDASWPGQRSRRLWRQVPNRRWYNWDRSEMPSAKEVVLFHRLV